LTGHVSQLAGILSHHPHYPTHTVEMTDGKQADAYRLPTPDIVLLENNAIAIRRPGVANFQQVTSDQLDSELHERIMHTVHQCNHQALQPVQQQYF
jgi:hypothetical protein